MGPGSTQGEAVEGRSVWKSQALVADTHTYRMGFTTFKAYVAQREAVHMLATSALPVLARINPWPTSSAHRRKLIPHRARPGIGTRPKAAPFP